MGTNITSLLKKLKSDMKLHESVGPKLTQEEITKLENKLGLKFPPSYKVFLQDFGDGAYWLYGSQPIDTISQIHNPWLKTIRADAPALIPVDQHNQVPRDSILLLMSEDSNGGSWCWLTSKAQADGEWPLAYYEPFNMKTLCYEVPTFASWLSLLIKNRTEVIRVLDKEDRLGLG
jgi:hypothetical protein